MSEKKQIIVVGKDISDAMRLKIAEFMEKENAEAVYVDSVGDYSHEQLAELIKTKQLVIAPDKENKTKKILIGGHCAFIGKTAMPEHMGVAHLAADVDGIVEVGAERLPKSFTDVYGEPPPPEPFRFTARPEIAETPFLVDVKNDDSNGTRQKKRRKFVNHCSSNSEAKHKKKKRLQKKARKNNRKK